jgi:hypothetical protein
MIEIKKPESDLNLTKTTILIEDVELNSGNQSQPINFTSTPILFITIQNDAGVQFNTLHLQDSLGRVLTHNVPLFPTTYSIAFSGKSSGQPLTQAELSSLNAVVIDWTFTGLAVGTLTINIYTFAI